MLAAGRSRAHEDAQRQRTGDDASPFWVKGLVVVVVELMMMTMMWLVCAGDVAASVRTHQT